MPARLVAKDDDEYYLYDNAMGTILILCCDYRRPVLPLYVCDSIINHAIRSAQSSTVRVTVVAKQGEARRSKATQDKASWNCANGACILNTT